MALTPKETARLAAMELVIPIVRPYFEALIEEIKLVGPNPRQPVDLILALVVGTLKDEYADLKARE